MVLDLLDMRSFSNLWYWIALAVTWSTASHWVLGVPYDMVLRARRVGGMASEDLVTLTAVNVRRLLMIGRDAGMALAVVVSFLLSALLVWGFVYHMEFAQAVVLIAGPLVLVGGLSLRTAARLEPLLAAGVDADTLGRLLTRHRISVQAVGLASIVVTTLWGMFQNLQLSILG